MRAIIIEDKDARALLDKLELKAMQLKTRSGLDAATIADVHRAFHYVVCTWLQEQGCNTVGR